jgi:hypothetical protein
MKKGMMVLAMTFVCATVQAQVTYRCGNTYSQTPCGDDAKVLTTPGWQLSKSTAPLPPDRLAGLETEQRAVRVCAEKVAANLKRPEGTRVVGPERGPLVWVEKLDGSDRRPARIYSGVLYGGYDGKKSFRCVLNMEETVVLTTWFND